MLKFCAGLAALGMASAQRVELAYAPVNGANPLKGLVPYSDADSKAFPHSMEFSYLALADLVKGEERYDWAVMDSFLDQVAGRGRQAVFRVHMEFPGRASAIPGYLLRSGLKVRKSPEQKLDGEVTPDYQDPRLRKMLQDFIAALGQRYDGDARIGGITAGLLGHWGEWHTHPHPEWFASPEVQGEVLDAYEKAFKKTPVLLRYPHDGDVAGYASNVGRGFGFHDDSFAWGTLDTGDPDQSWFYMPALKAAGDSALATWRVQPIGGEIRPEAWGLCFDETPPAPVQPFNRCVEETHASWLMDSGMFGKQATPERVARAKRAVAKMGYEYHVTAVTLKPVEGKELTLELEIENRGVAPFYQAWPARIMLLDEEGAIAAEGDAGFDVKGILPGEGARNIKARIPVHGVAAGSYRILLQVRNPMPKGLPLRFANQNQDADRDGWLTLGRTKIE